jgi:Fic family protein
MEPKFKYFELKLLEPAFGSKLTDLIIELDYLRKKKLGGSTHPRTFFQLKEIFHILESIGSARIEGNRTTIAEYIEARLHDEGTTDEKIREIQNMEKAMDFIDENIRNYPINRMLVSELHKMVVAGLSPQREGDATPGEYRMQNVRIARSQHMPPDYTQVPHYMDELFEFIQKDTSPKYDLLKTALVHHRFVWIHPFRNGNGRAVRLFTYAMLVKQGFNIDVGRIVNPTAVFCNDRQKYYDYLGQADSGEEQGLLNWCEYVLGGLKEEIQKIDRLLNYPYLSKEILLPAIEFSLERKVITNIEAKILKVAVGEQIFQASHIRKILPDKIPAEISRILRRLKEKKMIVSEKENTRKYLMSFHNNYLLRGIIKALGENGFLPVKE